MAISFAIKYRILGQFWITYRADEELKHFTEFNDVGLPLAYFIAEGLAKETTTGKQFIDETFSMFLVAMEVTENDVLDVNNLDDFLAVVGQKKSERENVSENDEVEDELAILKILSSPLLTKIQTTDFLDEHEECFDDQLLDLCEFCQELDGDVDVLRILASNPALDPSIQMRVLSESMKWQDREIGVIYDLVGNPSISNEVKEYILGEDAQLENFDPSWLIIEEISRIARSNPRISKKDIEDFLKIYAD